PAWIARGGHPEDGGIGGRSTDAARITAMPERVKVSEGSSSTDISWNTGDGSTGFVFVTANGRPPVLVATGKEGNRVISWIRRGNYVFQLYGDAERRTLFSSVNVSGIVIAPETLCPSSNLSHAHLTWMLLVPLST